MFRNTIKRVNHRKTHGFDTKKPPLLSSAGRQIAGPLFQSQDAHSQCATPFVHEACGLRCNSLSFCRQSSHHLYCLAYFCMCQGRLVALLERCKEHSKVQVVNANNMNCDRLNSLPKLVTTLNATMKQQNTRT